MAELVYLYSGTSKDTEPFYRDEGFESFMSLIKRYFNDGRLTQFTRILKKDTEELRLHFTSGEAAIAFETDIENWFKQDDENNLAKSIHRTKGQCTY